MENFLSCVSAATFAVAEANYSFAAQKTFNEQDYKYLLQYCDALDGLALRSGDDPRFNVVIGGSDLSVKVEIEDSLLILEKDDRKLYSELAELSACYGFDNRAGRLVSFFVFPSLWS